MPLGIKQDFAGNFYYACPRCTYTWPEHPVENEEDLPPAKPHWCPLPAEISPNQNHSVRCP